MTEIKLTRRGRRALKAGLDGFSAGLQLQMEITKRTGGRMDRDNLLDLFVELLERYGSAENALVAIKSGIVGLVKDD